MGRKKKKTASKNIHLVVKPNGRVSYKRFPPKVKVDTGPIAR